MTEFISTRILQHDAWEKLRSWYSESKYRSIFVLVDSNTYQYCWPLLQSNLPEIPKFISIIPEGESSKSIRLCEQIWQEWLDHDIDRKSLVIACGGGVVCDLGGFCAATVLRGVDCIYVPTSLMAMADAAHGGKTAVNLASGKNLVGLFKFPKLIVLETDFLNTLDERQLKNGWVEMIKHGLISNPTYWKDFEQMSWPVEVESIKDYLRKSIRSKLEFVEKDPWEKDLRKALNFGHTIGHAVESYLLDSGSVILHGEAIALGMIAESYISHLRYAWPIELLDRITRMLVPFACHNSLNLMDISMVQQKMKLDKKRKDGVPLFTLLQQPGIPVWDIPVTLDELNRAFEFCEFQLKTQETVK